MFSRPSGVGCASGCDDGVAGVVAWLLVHGQVADVVSSVSSRRSRLVGRGEERGVFIPGSVMAICPVLVSSCVSFLISSGVSLRSSCLRCVFLVSFSSRSQVACACSICPRARLVGIVSSSRLVVRLGRWRIVMCCLLDLPRWHSSHLVLSLRRAGRGAKRSDETS